MKKTKKTFLPALAAVAALVLALAGCGAAKADPRDELAKQVDEALTAMKQLDEADLEDVAADSLDSFKQLGIEPKDFYSSFMDGFAYKIGSIDLDEDAGTGTVHVAASCKSMSQILGTFTDELSAKVTELDADDLTEEKLMGLAGEILQQVTDQADLRDVDIDLPCTRSDDGSWAVDADAAEEALTSLFTE